MQTPAVAKSVPNSLAAIEVRCQAPFAVGVVLWCDEASRLLATVVAKATYGLDRDISVLLDDPDPIRSADELWDDGAARSVRFPCDLDPFKAAPEVLIVGYAYAPFERPAHAVTARVAIESVDKLIEATPPRRFDRDGRLQAGAPQTRFSLRYELAAGGPETDNPVGIDATEFTSSGGHRLPQLAPPHFDVRPGAHVPLVGLGPVGSAWPSRALLLRQEDRDWLADPVRRPKPKGFDPRYFSSAPIDQRTSEPFRVDERIILEGLHPAYPRLVTNLAGIAPILRDADGRLAIPPLVADTLHIDTDRQVATLTFRSVIPLGKEKIFLELVADGYDSGDTGDDAASISAGNGADATMELQRSDLAAAFALPFAPTSEPARARMPSSADDSALPFRPSSPPLALTPPTRPPVMGTPTKEAFPEPPPSRSTIGQLQSASRTDEERRPVEPPKPAPAPSSKGVQKDPFRKAFGGGAAAAPPSPKAATRTPSSPPAAAGAKMTLDDIKAAFSTAKAASDAAASSAVATAAPDAAAPIERTSSGARRAVVDLLAFDPEVPARLRRSRSHAPLLVDVPAARSTRKVDAPSGDLDHKDKERMDVLRVLSCGTPLTGGELHGAVDALLDDPYDFEIPLLLVDGEIKPTMDEVETLRVAVNLAKPHAGNNMRVQAALTLANEALAASPPPVSEAAAALYKQLEASTRELPLPSRYLADLVDRALLEARSYKKRTLLGAPRIRADLSLGRATLPIYLPDAVASQLPLLPVFPISALVELRPREDASETNPDALVAFAVGRVVRSRK